MKADILEALRDSLGEYVRYGFETKRRESGPSGKVIVSLYTPPSQAVCDEKYQYQVQL